jgi:hypothetical protein
MPVFQSTVTAFTFHLNLLVLGTANGRVAVYHRRRRRRLLDLDLAKPDWCANLAPFTGRVDKVTHVQEWEFTKFTLIWQERFKLKMNTLNGE